MTELFLQQAGRVVCVEPQPECVKALKKRFRNDRRVILLAAGLAEKPGALELSICSQANTLSTFSEEWKTGRFVKYKWDKVVRVPVTTLDEVIRQHGEPAYCKIDVEGFEMPVLRGLTRPVPLLSFEFTREFMGRARECVNHLRLIGFQRFNFILGENRPFACQGWLDGGALFDRLGQIADTELWGDIYAQHGDRFAGTPPQKAVAVDARPAPGRPAGAGGFFRRFFGGAASSEPPHAG
jgi:FkbM family methyltransferase